MPYLLEPVSSTSYSDQLVTPSDFMAFYFTRSLPGELMIFQEIFKKKKTELGPSSFYTHSGSHLVCFLKTQFSRSLSCIPGDSHDLSNLANYTRRSLFSIVYPLGTTNSYMFCDQTRPLSLPSHSCHVSPLDKNIFASSKTPTGWMIC